MIRVFSVLLSLLAALTLSGQDAKRPLRVAIYDFDSSNVRENVQLEIGRNVDYGKIAADMLLSKLVSDRIEVINRDQMQRLLKEQNMKFSDRFDASQATQFGKLLNVDAIITGKIQSLYTETKQDSSGLLGTVGLGRKKTVVTANVSLTAQMISTATAKTLAAPSADGVLAKGVGSELAAGGPVGRTKGAGGTSGSTTSTRTATDPYIRGALKDAIDKISHDLLEAAPRIPTFELARTSPPKTRSRRDSPSEDSAPDRIAAGQSNGDYVSLDDEVGTVLKVEEGSITFTVADGVRLSAGEKLEIQRAEMIRDPRTGRTIPVGSKVGTVDVTEVRSAYSKGTFSGTAAKSGDRVISLRPVTTRPKPRPPAAKTVTAPPKISPSAAPQNQRPIPAP